MCKSSSNQKKKLLLTKNTELHDQGCHHWRYLTIAASESAEATGLQLPVIKKTLGRPSTFFQKEATDLKLYQVLSKLCDIQNTSKLHHIIKKTNFFPDLPVHTSLKNIFVCAVDFQTIIDNQQCIMVNARHQQINMQHNCHKDTNLSQTHFI